MAIFAPTESLPSPATLLSAQISASKYQNLSQSPLKIMIPWSNLSKITKRSFSDTLKLCNPSYAILEVNTVTQLSDQKIGDEYK